MDSTGNADAAGRIVALGGSRTVRDAAETKAALLSALAGGGTVFLDCAAVTEADLSFVQMMIGAAKAATRHDARLALSAPPGGILDEALRRGGFAAGDDPLVWCKETM